MSPDELLALDSTFSVYDDLRQEADRSRHPGAKSPSSTTPTPSSERGAVRQGPFGPGARAVRLDAEDGRRHQRPEPARRAPPHGRAVASRRTSSSATAAAFARATISMPRTRKALNSRSCATRPRTPSTPASGRRSRAKARFIEQVRKGGTSTREVEDIGGEAANAAEMKAAASGNPLILDGHAPKTASS
jgi:hypothetical protein